MRFYGFDAKELTTAEDRNLSLDADPKLAWALRNRDFFPVDVNAASKEALLRVPGLGTRAVERILKIRKYHRLDESDLVKLHVPMKRAKYFLVAREVRARGLDEQGLAERILGRTEQLRLFEVA